MAGEKILVAVDASARTMDPVRLGEDFAHALGAPVVLFTAFPYTPLQETAGSFDREIREGARRVLLELGSQMDGVEVAKAEVVASSSPARALHRLSEQGEYALVVVGSTHRGRVGRVVPGSVGERLLSGAACPVAIAPRQYAERGERRLRRIGVAFDGSDEARQALATAGRLARRVGGELRVVAVHEPLAFGAQPAAFGVSAESLNERLQSDARRALNEALEHLPDGITAEGILRTGNAAEVLAEQGADLDLLVTGSRGYGPVGAVLLGGTTHRLMTAAPCPVLVVPRGVEAGLAAG